MEKPAARGRPFPTLALLAVYRTAPPPPGTDERTGEAHKLLFFAAPAHEPLTEHRKSRLVGTVMGMADFARMLSPTGPAVRAVHSTKQRMVWLEPEPDVFIHATIDLPHSPRHTRGESSNTNSSVYRAASVPPLQDTALLAALEGAYRQFRLLNGTIEGLLAREGRVSTLERLSRYWSAWGEAWALESSDMRAFGSVLSGVPSSSLPTAQITPLLTQFSVTNSPALPILMHGRSVVHLPTSPPGREGCAPPLSPTSADLQALVKHLSALLPVPLPALPVDAPEPSSPPTASSMRKPSGSRTTWDSLTFGMGHYLAPSSLSLNVLPSRSTFVDMFIPGAASSAPTAAGTVRQVSGNSKLADDLLAQLRAESVESTREVEKRRLEGVGEPVSSWSGLRNVSWSKMVGLGGVSPPDPAPTPSPPKTRESTLAKEEDHGQADVPSLVGAISLPLEAPPTPGKHESPAAELEEDQGQVDEPSLEEAISLPLEVVPVEAPPSTAPAVSSEQFVEHAVYVGKDELARVCTLTRGDFTLILLLPLGVETDEWLLTHAQRLLEAIEIVSLSSPAPAATSSIEPPPRYLLQRGALLDVHSWGTGKEDWSGRASTEENELEAGLFESFSHPGVKESFLRTGSAHWVVARRDEDDSKLFVVIPPRKTGKDVTLVDAAEDLRLLERSLKSRAMQ